MTSPADSHPSSSRTSKNSPAWARLSPDYERARGREDSLDRLAEWPAQRELLGDVVGKSFLDLGCGNGGKLLQLATEGAAPSVGVDISGAFLPAANGVELVRGDLSDPRAIPALAGRRFDRVMFLQSFGYASDPVEALRGAREMLAPGGFILLSRTQPIRYAVEQMERNGTTLGEEYFSTADYSYRSGWNEDVTLTKRPYTMADLLNAFSDAGLWIERTVEPQIALEDRKRYPHKQDWMNRYLGILVFKLRAHHPEAVTSR